MIRRALAAIPSAIPWLLVALIVLMMAQASVGIWRELQEVPVQVRVYQCGTDGDCVQRDFPDPEATP